jgi:LacI family transcriptional regulator/LacI family xylobiose transport system transcriptional regulator
MEGRLTPGRQWAGQVLARRPVGVIGVSTRMTAAQQAQLMIRATPPVSACSPVNVTSNRTGSSGWSNAESDHVSIVL